MILARILILSLVALVSSCRPSEGLKKGRVVSINLDNLYGQGVKYWDPHFTYGNEVIGTGWCFYTNNRLREFASRNEVRIWRSYDDVIIDTLSWKVIGDTLLIDSYRKCIILKLTKDTLEVQDILRIWGRDKLLFTRSPDQETAPVVGDIFSDDSTEWKVKVKILER